jgi:hypothetical protein
MKTQITKQQADLIYDAIEIAIENYGFNNTDLYEVDFYLDYNNRLCVENIEFTEYNSLAEKIYRDVMQLFNTQNTNKESIDFKI